MAKKTVNSDIYNLSQLVDDVKSVFIPNETEETLAIGTYGYIGALESHRLQTQVQMTGELANEVFPSRARLERNVITHAILANIDGINAVPAKMTAFLAIKESDIIDNIGKDNNIFIIDRECPLIIGDYEFHIEYDIQLQKIKVPGNDNINAYTATYIIPPGRTVPTSNITSYNQYLNPPAIISVDGENYIYLTVILSQVHHQIEQKKLVTSNVIDNKTMNFEFEDQLAYFEVHCAESDQDYYLTPIFEGSAIPEGTNYYCWYQYIDTDLIRVRFDRNSYMPGLNTLVECLVKTTKGSEGNFKYAQDSFAELESSIYGYKGITCLITPISDSQNGKDRKSKKELQALIPKETFARGSLTTITDLNNYFSMLDSENGRIIIQKKIDNQIERVYYAYFVAKDTNGNIIPSNTLDIKVGLEDLIESRIAESDAPRYLLKSGTCFKLGSDGICYVNHEPILDKGWALYPKNVSRSQIVVNKFKAVITDSSYDEISCSAAINGSSTPSYVFGKNKALTPIYIESGDEIEVEDYIQMSVGSKYKYIAEYTVESGDTTITFNDDNLEYFTFVKGSWYDASDPETIYEIDALPFEINLSEYENIGEDSKLVFNITNLLNEKAGDIVDNTIINHLKIEEKGNLTNYTTFVPTLSQNTSYIGDDYTEGQEVEYTLTYKSISSSYTPEVIIKFARGLEYISGSNEITYQDGTKYPYEPGEVALENSDLGFIYTNPYGININGYRLYSAFYMMSMSENPYLNFYKVNNKSNIQFISTNAYWNRPFYDNSDTYTLKVRLQQSVQENIGLFPENSDTGMPLVKAIAVFYRDDEPYRYKSLNIDSWDPNEYTIDFSQTFTSEDVFDKDNNIKVTGVQVCGQQEFSIIFSYNGNTQDLNNGGQIQLSDLIASLHIDYEGEIDSVVSDSTSIYVEKQETGDYLISALTDFEDNIVLKIITKVSTINPETGETEEEYPEYDIEVSCNNPSAEEYGFFNPTTNVRIYTLCGIPDIEGVYSNDDINSICPGLNEWTLTNVYDIANGVTFYHNYSEIMGSRVKPYGTKTTSIDEGGHEAEVLDLEGYYVSSVPLLGYDYCKDEMLIQDAINALNDRKAYIDNACILLENSFGIDFKLFNTYGPSRVFYIIKDADSNKYLDDSKEYIDRTNITINFRVKLVASNDSYTVNNIKTEVKNYIEELDDLGEIHIPNLVTQITNNYSEQITYFEYLGFNDYGADIQHIYKDIDEEIPIHTAPEFININNVLGTDNVIYPDINIYVSEI